MTYAEMISKINDFLIEDFEVEPSAIIPTASLKNTLDLDSLDYIDLIVAIDNNFGVKVKPEDFQEMISVENFYHFIAKKINTAIPA